MEQKENIKPTEVFREGSVQAAVFEREMKGKNGKPFVSKSVVLQTGYQDKEGEWVNKRLSVIKNDIKPLLEVLAKAGAFVGSFSSQIKLEELKEFDKYENPVNDELTEKFQEKELDDAHQKEVGK